MIPERTTRSRDYGRGIDHVGLSDAIRVKDQARWRSRWDVYDFLDSDGKVADASRRGLPDVELAAVMCSSAVVAVVVDLGALRPEAAGA
jgi:hypothetical protein